MNFQPRGPEEGQAPAVGQRKSRLRSGVAKDTGNVVETDRRLDHKIHGATTRHRVTAI
jgi:hypothetical protein